MAGFADVQGSVQVEPVPARHGSRILRYTFHWDTIDANGIACLNCPFPIDGELYEAISVHKTAGAGTHSIFLYDENDLDKLRGLCAPAAGLPNNIATSVPLTQIVTSGSAVFARGSLVYIARPVFRVTHSTPALHRGVFYLDLPTGAR